MALAGLSMGGMQEDSYASTKEKEEKVLAAGVPLETFEGYGYHN